MKLSKRKMRVKEIKKLRILSENQKEQWLEELYDKITENPEVILSKTEVDFIKSCIDEVEGEDIDFHMVSKFICATRDGEFIKECLENKSFEFEDYQKVDMIRGTNDVEYIKKSIAESQVPSYLVYPLVRHLINFEDSRSYSQYVSDLISYDEYPAELKAQLIESIKAYEDISDVMYISYVEMCMEDKKCALDSQSKAQLILSMRDLEKMKSKVKSADGNIEYPLYESQLLYYLKKDSLELESIDKANLIISTEDYRYFNQCILDKQIGLKSSDISLIIKSLKRFQEIDSMRYSRLLLSYLTSPEVEINSSDRLLLIKGLEEFPELKEEKIENKPCGKLSQYDCFITTILKQHFDGKKELDVFERIELLKSISNTKLLEYFIKSKIIPVEYSSEVILATGNNDFIISCIENDKLNIDAQSRASLVIGLNDKEILKQYIQRDDFFDSEQKRQLIIASKDEAFIKECIKSKTLNLHPVDKVLLIGKEIKDEEYRKACLHDENLGLDIMAYDGLIDEVGTEEEKEKWNNRILRIKNLSEVSLKELEETDKDIIELQDSVYPFYAKEEFVEIKKKINEILEGIEIPEKGDEKSELKTFLEISKRLANHISYNQYAVSKEGEKDHDLQRECRSLYGGLVNGESVCAGYANILNQTLAIVGIEAKYIKGFSEEGDGHAWNQVKIGDKWYNVDLTWARNEIVRTGDISKEILKSDQEFEDHLKYSRSRTPFEEKCINSMQEESNLYKRKKKEKNNQDEMDV